MSDLTLVPVTFAEVKRFIADHHRHSVPPLTWKFGVGAECDGELVGVAAAGLPKGRMLMDRYTLEVNRTCTDGTPNANSMLYGAVARAAKALGYRKLVTYTLVDESGSSLRAAGWVIEAETRAGRSWELERGHGYDRDLFGTVRQPPGAKLRWRKDLAA